MTQIFHLISTWLDARRDDDERGASLVEYALLVALIAIVCIIAVQILGESASTTFSSAGTGIGNAGN